jgi:hypothetical protein
LSVRNLLRWLLRLSGRDVLSSLVLRFPHLPGRRDDVRSEEVVLLEDQYSWCRCQSNMRRKMKCSADSVITYIAGQCSIRKGCVPGLASCGDSKRSNGAVKSLLMKSAPGFVCFDVVSDLFVGFEEVSPVATIAIRSSQAFAKGGLDAWTLSTCEA